LTQKIRLARDIFYTYWIASSFSKHGILKRIEYPLFLFGGRNISIGDNIILGARLRLEAYEKYIQDRFSPAISIGNNVIINYDCHIACINKVSIGDNVLIASKVFITDHNHGAVVPKDLEKPPTKRSLSSKGPVIIDENVWIGENVVILPNVHIGANAIIGANSVVSKNVPANAIAAGSPARIIKTLKK
jgi:acetyltransferase-like isoleucine patch superfamily enzyme